VHAKRVSRIFVENVFAWQLGDAPLNESDFFILAEEVHATLETKPGFHETLLASHGPGESRK
jgi:hypothetical protein